MYKRPSVQRSYFQTMIKRFYEMIPTFASNGK